MTFDDDLFREELRQRLKKIIERRRDSIAKVARTAGDGGNTLKFFLNGSTTKVDLPLFLRWASALDVHHTTLVDNIGYIYERNFDPYKEVSELDEKREAERVERLKIGHKMKFWREVLGQSHKDFAKAAKITNEKGPDVDYIKACEAGDKRLSVIEAKYLVDHYLLELSDILPRHVS